MSENAAAELSNKSLLTLLYRTTGRYGIFKCECGSEKELDVYSVKYMVTISCGCYRKKRMESLTKTHGLTNHPLFGVWNSIKCRCYNQNHPTYVWYGAKGATVCDEWKYDFKAFYGWCINNGWRPSLEIDKDIKGGNVYSPDNCLFVTAKENTNHRTTNRVIEYNGVLKTMQQWAEEYGLNKNTLLSRLSLNWSVGEALTIPVNHKKQPLR